MNVDISNQLCRPVQACFTFSCGGSQLSLLEVKTSIEEGAIDSNSDALSNTLPGNCGLRVATGLTSVSDVVNPLMSDML
jgi:hypothetical protein